MTGTAVEAAALHRLDDRRELLTGRGQAVLREWR